ncbi:MAG: hypothetical protein DCC67_08100 [Planctomycetota bacterium]|nr:MAG: hypothetical protein DCC67_08100 [Planctomycetota bacterium]
MSTQRRPRSQRRGRPAPCLLLLAGLFCTTGATCTPGFRNPFAAWQPPAPEVLTREATLDQIVAAVNQNAARISSYQTNNASITVPGMPGVPLLRGNIAAQRPGRVRFQASTALTGPEVDLGANDELFWFWAKRNQPPALYFARHDQYSQSAARQMMPIEPQWLLDALGFAEFRPGDRHEGPRPLDKDRIEITSTAASRGGLLTKRTVVDARRAWILEQHVYDANGTLLASAVARAHRYYPDTGVSLPQLIELRIPASELSLSIDVGTVAINRLPENPQLWTMPSVGPAPAVDLGAMSAAAAAPSMGDHFVRGDWYGPGPSAAGQPPPMVMAPGAQLAPAPAAEPASQSLAIGGVTAPAPPGGAVQGAQRLPSGGVPADAAMVR